MPEQQQSAPDMTVEPSQGSGLEPMPTDFHVVIRYAGERTGALCRLLVEEVAGRERTTVIETCPFETAVTECFDLGLRHKVEWLFTIDADVLVDARGFDRFIAYRLQCRGSIFHYSGMVYDKIFGEWRTAGVRAYRGTVLAALRELVPDPGVRMRPETGLIKDFMQGGSPRRKSEATSIRVGGHDFEQWHRDLYRKGRFHSLKFDYRLPKLINQWRARQHEDADFSTILLGVAHGILCDPVPCTDARDFQSERRSAIVQPVPEKPPLGEESYQVLGGQIRDRCDSDKLTLAGRCARRAGRLARRFAESRRTMGLLRALVHFLGLGFSALGRRLTLSCQQRSYL